MNWLRSYMLGYMQRKGYFLDKKQAMETRNRLSVIYAFLGWNTMLLSIYVNIKHKFPEKNDATQYAKILGVKEAAVVSYSGLSKVRDYEIDLRTDEEKEKDIHPDAFFSDE